MAPQSSIWRVSFFRLLSRIVLLLLLVTIKGDQTINEAGTFIHRPEVKSFIEFMHQRYNMKLSRLRELFSQVSPRPKVTRSTPNPVSSLGWNYYYQHFLTPERIHDGVRFWHQYHNTLAQASNAYGVPEDLIVSILGIESRYGKNTGRYRAIDSLSTLAFNYPDRKAYFKGELAQFLLFSQETNLNPLHIRGSWAGAIGWPQFMPGNARHYAIDMDHDGKSDILNDPEDAIGSVANYFHQQGWQKDGPIAIPVKFASPPLKGMPLEGTLRSFLSNGVQLDTTTRMPLNIKARLIILHSPKHTEYWLGFHNLEVLHEYNHSMYYTMAAYELAHAIKLAYKKKGYTLN